MLASLFTRSSLVLIILAGCFAEVGSTGEEDPTVAQTCVAGDLGCACYGNATCDAGLDCVTALDVCVPMDCAAGALQCVCDGGRCDGALVCVEGVCLEMTPGTASADPSGDPSDDAGSTDESSGAGTSSDPSADSGGTSSSGSGEVGEVGSEGETGVPDCGALPCGECVACVASPGAECSEQASHCSDEAGCEAAAACLSSCGVKGLCLDDCCATSTPAAASAAVMLNSCRHDECAVACSGDYNVGQCGG